MNVQMMTLFLEVVSIYSLFLLNSMRYRNQKRESMQFQVHGNWQTFFPRFFPMIWICLINQWSLHKISSFCGGIHMKKDNIYFISNNSKEVFAMEMKSMQWVTVTSVNFSEAHCCYRSSFITIYRDLLSDPDVKIKHLQESLNLYLSC